MSKFEVANTVDSEIMKSKAFQTKIKRYIKKGLSFIDAAEKLGIEPYGTGFRQLYCNMQREEDFGVVLPTLSAKGSSDSSIKNIEDSGIKHEGADLKDIESRVRLENMGVITSNCEERKSCQDESSNIKTNYEGNKQKREAKSTSPKTSSRSGTKTNTRAKSSAKIVRISESESSNLTKQDMINFCKDSIKLHEQEIKSLKDMLEKLTKEG